MCLNACLHGLPGFIIGDVRPDLISCHRVCRQNDNSSVICFLLRTVAQAIGNGPMLKIPCRVAQLLFSENRIELLAGLDEGGTFTQPLQFLGTGVSAGAAHSTKQVLDCVFDFAAIRHLDFSTFR